MIKLCLTLILMVVCTGINCSNLPVFIWGPKTQTSVPVLGLISGDDFIKLVKTQSENSLTVVFVERSLSVEDLSQCRIKTNSCFENLRKIPNKTYLPAVEDPVKTLRLSYEEEDQSSIEIFSEDDLSEKFAGFGSEKLLFVYLDMAEHSEDFAKHDEIISKFYEKIIAQRENVIAIYTAEKPSFFYSKPLVRVARQAPDENKKKNYTQHVIRDEVFWIAMDNMTINDETVDPKTIDLSISDTDKNTTMQVNLRSGSHHVAMKINSTRTEWFVLEFIYNDQTFKPKEKVYSYRNRSYGCHNLTIKKENQTIYFESLQMLPLFFIHGNETIKNFTNPGVECIGYVSSPILGGVFICMILVGILVIAITMILDIKPNDRFDDVKGKVLFLNAQE